MLRIPNDGHYTEGPSSTFSSNGKTYQLDKLFEITHNRHPITISVSELKWVLEHLKLDPRRVAAADISVPILIHRDPKYGLVVVDGAHRLAKAVQQKRNSISAKMITDREMAEALIPAHTRW